MSPVVNSNTCAPLFTLLLYVIGEFMLNDVKYEEIYGIMYLTIDVE